MTVLDELETVDGNLELAFNHILIFFKHCQGHSKQVIEIDIGKRSVELFPPKEQCRPLFNHGISVMMSHSLPQCNPSQAKFKDRNIHDGLQPRDGAVVECSL